VGRPAAVVTPVRPTPAGRRVIAAAAVALVAGRLGGLPELSFLGLACAAVVALTWIRLRILRPRIDAERTVSPRRVHHGETCHVELTVHDTGRRTLPVTTLTDHLDGEGLAGLSLAPLHRGERRPVRYRFRARRRGVARLGPLRVTAVDPFGLVVVEAWRPTTTEVVVLPRVHPVRPLPPAPGEQPEHRASARRLLALAHDEASTLREYVPGDDVRHVHWPATARFGHPVVRQVEEPWQRRTVVLLDTRRAAHTEDGFERAVSAAASVAVAAHRNGEAVRLVRTDGHDSGLLDTERQVEALLDELAAVQLHHRGSLGGALAVVGADGGTLVVCLGDLLEERTALAAAARRHGRTVVVACGSRSIGLDATVEVRFDRDDVLTSAWDEAVPSADAVAVERR